ncbi:MAG TPA: hypothetical protein VFS48_08915 [Solirubrobacterales bacterium]|nr:hypothetical protein [Solirubrobacterales bacterium]
MAAAILAEDAKATGQVAERKSVYASLDPQPAAAAMANERRAIVATAMRKEIAPAAGWTLIEDNLRNGAYEWIAADGVAVRLSKTTPESRLQEAAKALQGVQSQLIELPPPPDEQRETILLRLMGNPLSEVSVDVIPVSRKGVRASAIPLKAIATMKTERFQSGSLPTKPSVTLPGVRRAAESE